ncbi:hypothetical protein AVEN_56670-1 [Araneus ventricosus]|uniref:Transposable element Tc3 transposase n=1 Tax=Araneus ventricosus TaxID=182803 RepID=A0A4Y2LW74_ARAVE|nr:hypothetical protein AVEN_56670-1 [Araneus ventricosus]
MYDSNMTASLRIRFQTLSPMETFQNQVIGYDGLVEWPPRSPNFTPLDFFLWGHIKGRVYATPPPTLQDHRRRITDTCASVTPAVLHNVQRKIQNRVQICNWITESILSNINK